MQEKEKVTVYYLEGVHGCGKTTLLRALSQLGFLIVEENFMEHFAGFLKSDSHTFLTEAAWAGNALNSVILRAEELRKYRSTDLEEFRDDDDEFLKAEALQNLPPVIFADRSYLTGLIYGKLGDIYNYDLYENLCIESIHDLAENYNIQSKFVRIDVDDRKYQFEKILQRARGNATRQTLKEEDKVFFLEITQRYDHYQDNEELFDYVFINDFTHTKIAKTEEIDGSYTKYLIIDLLPFFDAIELTGINKKCRETTQKIKIL